jgi:hypothetical protein
MIGSHSRGSDRRPIKQKREHAGIHVQHRHHQAAGAVVGAEHVGVGTQIEQQAYNIKAVLLNNTTP